MTGSASLYPPAKPGDAIANLQMALGAVGVCVQ